MIYLLHGDDLVKSRTLISNQQKKLNIEKRTELILGEVEAINVLEATASTDLFGNVPFVVVDISKAAKSSLEELVEVLKKVNQECTLILFSNKELTKTNPLLQNAIDLKIKVMLCNKVPEGNVFKFVDALFNKNRKSTYLELENLLKEDADPFYLFSMVLYGLRNLANIAFESPASQKMNPFVKTKAVSQLKQFSPQTIQHLFTEAYELDKKAKTGGIEPDLALTLLIEKVINS